MEIIQSRDNANIKEYIKICTDKKKRHTEGVFAVEGTKTVLEAVSCGITVLSAFVLQSLYENDPDCFSALKLKSSEFYLVSDSVCGKMAQTKTPQGVFCVCQMKTPDQTDISGRWIALEGLQDPGNLGTVIRTADAFGMDGVLLSQDCADPYSHKVIRAAMGSLFRIRCVQVPDLSEFIKNKTKNGFSTFAAVPSEDADDVRQVKFTKDMIIVVGNEGSGLSKEIVESCSDRITVPMSGGAESLNAAVAAAVMIWESVRSLERGVKHE